jgi:hypothetical protein
MQEVYFQINIIRAPHWSSMQRELKFIRVYRK